MAGISVILLSWLSLSVQAAVVQGLYQATVPVGSQSAAEQKQAATVALERVLIKVSGNPNVLDVGSLTPSLAHASDYVQEYSYQQGVNNSLLLQIKFDRAGINRLLKSAQQSVWDSNRPLVLMWLVKGQTGRLQLISNDDSANIAALLQQNAERRGLPIILPLGDLQDLSDLTLKEIQTAAVWGDPIANILAASHRYKSDMEVIGQIIPPTGDNGTWEGQWTLLNGNQQQNWRIHSSTLEILLSTFIDQLASKVAAHYISPTLHNSEENTLAVKTLVIVRVEITHVSDIAELSQLISYLRSLAPIKKVQIVSIEANKVVLEVNIVGGQAALMQAVALEQRLIPIVPPLHVDEEEQLLRYQWHF